jgi:hypothetical protein
VLAANNVLFFVGQRVGGFPGQVVVVSVVLPVLWYTAMFAGLARLPRPMESGLMRATFWLDATTVFVSGLLILLYVFAHTPGRSSLDSPLWAVVTIGFPALHGAVIFAAVVVFLRPAHGGGIRVERVVGRGTTFVPTIPAAPPSRSGTRRSTL